MSVAELRTDRAVDRVVDALRAADARPTRRGGRDREEYAARCPAHEDRDPSLSVTDRDGRVLVYCHAGCSTDAVVAALGLTMRDLFDRRGASYTYDSGRTVHRRYGDDGRKRITQSATDRPCELFHLGRVREAVAAGAPVWIAEGEEDALTLDALGVVGTTAPMGAGNWRRCDYAPLRGGRVVIVTDGDAAGTDRARGLVEFLPGLGAVVEAVVSSPVGNDVTDGMAAGLELEGMMRESVAEFMARTSQNAASAEPLSLDDLAGITLDDLTARADPGRVLAELVTQHERRLATDLGRSLREPDAAAFDAGTVAEVLAREPGPAARVAGLVPADAFTVIVAQRKTGKTTLCLNLARSLTTGEPFLGRFAVRALEDAERVALLNFEVTGATVASWARAVGVPEDRLVLVNVRDRRNPFAHPRDAAQLAEYLRRQHAAVVIVDPFSRAFTGQNPNDGGQVGPFLAELNRWTRADVGASDLFLTAHAGWSADGRAKGSTELEDSPDAILYLTRDPQGQTRHLRAEGRDVDMPRSRLTFDPQTRRMEVAGAVAVPDQLAADRLLPEVVAYIAEHPGTSQRAIVDAVEGRAEEVRAATRIAEERGLVRIERPAMRGRSAQHYAEEVPE